MSQVPRGSDPQDSRAVREAASDPAGAGPRGLVPAVQRSLNGGIIAILIGLLLVGILIGLLLFMPSIGSFFSQGGLSVGGPCNQQCDPNGSTCDPGLSCQREPDGGYVCWGGQDATGESCGAPARPTGGVCNSPCDPAHL